MKIKGIVASEQIPKMPAPYARPSAFGLLTAQAVGGLGPVLEETARDVEHIALYEKALEKKKKEFDDVTHATRLKERAELEFDSIRRDLEGTDPNDHEKLTEVWNKRRNEVRDTITKEAGRINPEVMNLTERALIPIMGAEEIRARSIQDSKWKQWTVSNLMTTIDYAKNKAPEIGNPEQRKEFLGYINGRIDKMYSEGIFGIGPEGAKTAQNLKSGLIEGVEFNQLRIDALNNPINAMGKLGSGLYDLPPEKQIEGANFIDAQIRHKVTEKEHLERKIQEEIKQNRETIKTHLTLKIREGESIDNIITELVNDGIFRTEDAEYMSNVQYTWMKRKQEELQTKQVDDEATDLEFRRRLYSPTNPLKYSEVAKALEMGKLTTKRADHYDSLIRSIEKEKDAETEKQRAYYDNIGQQALTTTGWQEKFDPVSNNAKVAFSEELYKAVYKDKLKAEDVVWKILENQRKAMAGLNLPEIATMRKRIKYGDQNAPVETLIKTLFSKEKELSKSEFDSQLQTLKDIADKESWTQKGKETHGSQGEGKR